MSRFRHEYKYFLDPPQKEILQIKANTLLMKDSHTNEDGKYKIKSLYFDNIGNECLKDNLYGSDPRAKFRIRYYNNNLSRIVLEKKYKKRGMCYKQSIPITIEECKEFMKGHIPTISNDDSSLKIELLSEMATKGLIPKTIVTYVRTPYVYPAGNVRITFDEDITSSNDISHFLEEKYIQRPVFGLGQSLLEVKWDELLPKHIQDVLCLENLNWTAFSKYYMCRLFEI